MDDCDRASITEEQQREAALAAVRAARTVRRYRLADRDQCSLCGGQIEPCRTAWSDHCASCARDEEQWQRRR